LALAGEAGLELHDVATGARRMLAAGPAGGPLLWSPDGSKIILRYGEMIPWPIDPESTYQRLYVIDVAGRGQPVLLGDVRRPGWSPDGRYIAYLSEGCVTEDWNIYAVRGDGSSKVALTETPQTVKEGPAWSPTGSDVAFSTLDKVVLVDADSGKTRTIAVFDGFPVSGHLHISRAYGSPWSPDGRYLTFGVGGGHGICT
jgi:Tol biopolymer transport system component